MKRWEGKEEEGKSLEKAAWFLLFRHLIPKLYDLSRKKKGEKEKARNLPYWCCRCGESHPPE